MTEGSSGSRQRPRQRCATVDHSDIRGSSASSRHHGRDPSGAAFRLGSRFQHGGFRIGGVEDSLLPRATTAAVYLRLAPSSSCDSLSFSGSLARRNLHFPLHVYADGPDEVEQFAPNGRDGLLFALATPDQPHIALMQVLARDCPRVTHQLARVIIARELPKLGHDRHGADVCDPAQALQSFDHRAHLHRQALDRRLDRALQTCNALGGMLDLRAGSR
jgi:hypothetical protein